MIVDPYLPDVGVTVHAPGRRRTGSHQQSRQPRGNRRGGSSWVETPLIRGAATHDGPILPLITQRRRVPRDGRIQAGQIDQAILIDQIGLMYRAGDGRTDARPGRRSAGVLAAGGTPGAVAAAARAGSQRPPGPRADRPDRPSATPGVLPS